MIIESAWVLHEVLRRKRVSSGRLSLASTYERPTRGAKLLGCRLALWMWVILGISVDHKVKALFGSGKLGDVVVGMRSSDVLLH